MTSLPKKMFSTPLIQVESQEKHGWKFITEPPTIQFSKEQNNEVSLADIKGKWGPRDAYLLDFTFDFPGVEGGDQENLDFVVVLVVFDQDRALSVTTTDAQKLEGRLVLGILEEPRLDIVYSVQVWVQLEYSDGREPVVLQAPARSLRLVE